MWISEWLNAYLIFGVNERDEIIDIDNSHGAVTKFEQSVVEYISPKVFLAVQAEELSNKLLITIEIPAGSDDPIAFKDTTDHQIIVSRFSV